MTDDWTSTFLRALGLLGCFVVFGGAIFGTVLAGYYLGAWALLWAIPAGLAAAAAPIATIVWIFDA